MEIRRVAICCDVDVRCSKYEASGLGVADVELELVADARRVDREARHVVVAGAERVRAVAYHVAGPIADLYSLALPQ